MNQILVRRTQMAKIISFGKLLNRVVENASAADKEEKFTPDKWRLADPPKKRPATDSDRKHNPARYNGDVVQMSDL
jgi:hypothetical protein